MNAIQTVGSVNIPSLQMAEQELIDVLQSSIYPGAKPESIKLVIGYCKGAQLDPMTKPVHIVPMNVKVGKGRDDYEWRDVVMPGIELYRTKAARTGQYVGIDEAEFGQTIAGDDDIGIKYPEWCKVTVYRLVNGVRCGFSSGRVYWIESYATAGRNETKPNAMWRKRPWGQIEKCAEAMALRRAFPEIGGDNVREELEGKVIDNGAIEGVATRVEMPKAKQEAIPEHAGGEPSPIPQQQRQAETIDRDTGEIQQQSNDQSDVRPMPDNMHRVLRATIAKCGLTDIDVKAVFARGLDEPGWTWGDYAKVDKWARDNRKTETA